MPSRPRSVDVSIGFILLNAVIWFILGVLIALNAIPGIPELPLIRPVLTGLSVVIAAVLAVLVIFTLRHRPIAYYLVLASLIITILLTIFDEFGVSDLFVLILNILPLALLLKDRRWYLQGTSGVKDSA